jgi:hypothetical protein
MHSVDTFLFGAAMSITKSNKDKSNVEILEIEFWDDDCGLADLAKDAFANESRAKETSPAAQGRSAGKVRIISESTSDDE